MKWLKRARFRRMVVPLVVAFLGTIVDFFVFSPLFSSRFIFDFPLLMILYFSFYEEESLSLLPVIFLACLRDVVMGGAAGGFLFGSLAIFFTARFLYDKLYVESEMFLFIMVSIVFVGETAAVWVVRKNIYEFSQPAYFLLYDAFRIIINSFVSIPLFYTIVARVKRPVFAS